MIPFILKSNSVTMFPPSKAPLTVDASHINFAAVVEAIKAGDFDLAVELGTPKNYLRTVTSGDVTITDDAITYKGTPITGYLANKLLAFFRDGLPVQHYCLFLSNLMANPSMTSRNELYLFLEAADLPITDDGCFLAYKAVRSDFKDKHSGKYDNSPGITHTMPRHDVDDNRNQTCSYGFHAAAYDYARNFMSSKGDKLVAVKINPADVVSVPADYNNQKLRTCKYTILFEVPDASDVFKDRHYVPSEQPVYDPEYDSYAWHVHYESDEDVVD